MKTKLDQIEARLQALIESSVVLFARGDAQHRLAHELVTAVQENILFEPDGRTLAPNMYTIYLHPDSLAYWQEHHRLLESIASSLQEAAREFGVFFLNDPILRLSPAPDLPLDGISVVASSQYEPSGQTAAFAAQPAPTGNNTIPSNAFLIVDGNQVFPLNRTVINIGRRVDNHLVLADPRVSRAHAQIRAIRGQYVLFDLNSTGGTMVNGRRMRQYTLKPGDVISLSGVPLIYGEDTPNDALTTRKTRLQGPTDGHNGPPEIIE
jgi:hypothetical protein